MTESELLQIIKNGENLRTEFKESRDKLPANLFETVCAFLNTKGGFILLGVDDAGNIKGINKKVLSKLKKDIANLANNPQKLSPGVMLPIDEFHLDDKVILVIKVPESAQVHKTNNEIYVRNEDGDYRVTHPVEIAKIVNRKQNYYSKQTVFPQISFTDFNVRLIARAKNLIRNNNPAHHWLELDDQAFLARAGFFRKEKSGKNGYTLAAVLFFGTDDLIQSVLPAYKFEALLRRENVDRYDDRLTVRTNLLDAYDLLMGFIEKHLNDPFYLEDNIRISLRSKIFRELVVNIIAHREYMHPSPAMIQILPDVIEFTNPNNPVVFGKIDPAHFTPIAKNPTISKFLLQMGLVEEVGSGMRNVYKYLPHYAKGATAEFLDGEPFKTIIKLGETSEKMSEKVSEKMSEKMSEKIISLISKNPKITAAEMAKALGKSSRTIERKIRELKQNNRIKRIGPDKGGYWQVIEGKKD
ncbi:RNA-binding domain-containing protein [Calditrichota bacterium GD2]